MGGFRDRDQADMDLALVPVIPRSAEVTQSQKGIDHYFRAIRRVVYDLSRELHPKLTEMVIATDEAGVKTGQHGARHRDRLTEAEAHPLPLRCTRDRIEWENVIAELHRNSSHGLCDSA